MRSILPRYVVREFFSFFNPIFFGLFALGIVIRFTKAYVTPSFLVKPSDALDICLLIMPMVLQSIAPLAFLLALSITLAKLASTSELTALQACSIPPARLFRIFGWIALFFFASTMAIMLWVKPACARGVRHILLRSFFSISADSIMPREFVKLSPTSYFYVDDIEGSRMKKVFYMDLRSGGTPLFISASGGTIVPQGDHSLFKLDKGNYIEIVKGRSRDIDFHEMQFAPFFMGAGMTARPYDSELDTSVLVAGLRAKTLTRPQLAELVYRIALPFSIFVYLFLAFPLSFGQARNYKTAGILISIGIGISFFILFNTVRSLSEAKSVNPFVAHGISIAVQIGAGVALCRRKRIFMRAG